MTSNLSQTQGGKPLIKSMKKMPSQLIKDQESGKSIIEQFPKPKIIQFLNIGDHSIHTDSQVHVDEPLFSPEPHVIQFTNYEPLQTMEQILKLRNKDKVARSLRIVPPDSKLFSVTPARVSKPKGSTKGNLEDIDQMSTKVAPGMEISYIVKFSPEAKSDYAFDLIVLTEREKFIVPIRAIGCRAMLEFPDSLDFGLVPVKFETEKAVMIRNVGEKTTKWQIRTPPGFKIDKKEGILEVGRSDQLTFVFLPQLAKKVTEELTLTYDNMEAVIPVTGEAHNDNVYLSKTHIHAEPTSITLFSHQYYQILNKSQVPIEFSWRAFATEAEENEKKLRLTAQLAQEEHEEHREIESGNLDDEDEDDDGSLDSDDSYNETELAVKAERKKERALITLGRKYASIKKAVDEDKMLFQDEIFSIEPLEGKIWPNTEMTFCMTFRPQGPYHYSCTAFCNTTCAAERLALNLTGQGKGPQAQLSITEMDIGDIFVTNMKSFEVAIENTGEIDCHWKLIPFETPFGSKFKFSKSEGTLGVKEHQRDAIKVTFISDILGEFSETFRFALEGSSEMLTLTFKGHVVAPTFRFSEDIIDFGRVSYKFPVTKTLYLTNTSDVEINYVVRVPGDGRSLKNEFNITNERGTLGQEKQAEITIEFIPACAQIYDNVLVVDLEGVGQDMLAVPIRAECLVPKVVVDPNDFLDYGTCFLRHSKTQEIKIVNKDNLRAKFEIVVQDDQSKRIGTYEADVWSGVIEPLQTQTVALKLRTEILNRIRIPIYIKLEGTTMPVLLTLMAESIGPIVDVDRRELEYGAVEVLRDYTEKLVIKNESKIDAEYTAFTKTKESIWKVVQRHGILKPDENKIIEVVCNADEVQRFQDTLHIIINNGMDLEVGLKARGVGSTLFCKEGLSNIDFGVEYTHKNVPKQFFLENRGRKPMAIQWQRQTKSERKKKPTTKETEQTAKTASASGLQGIAEKVEEELQYVYTVVPEKVNLNPKMGIMIEFRANSFKVGTISETWQCLVMIGSERKPKPVFTSQVVGKFITPSLSFNNIEKSSTRERSGAAPTKLDFKYVWEKGVPAMPICKDLVIKNTGPLPTSIMLKIDQPFSCPVDKLTLSKDESDTVRIDFDPSIQQNRISDHLNGKLAISHQGHPHKDTVLLQGEVCFPNLQILPPNIDFGCILNDTGKKKYLTLTNVSEMPVAYEWSFLEEAPLLNEQDEIDQMTDSKKKKKKKKKAKILPINEVFDILPVSGILQPGETENVEFTFYAGNGLNYQGMAVCSVDGGPDYDVPITGDSSFVSYNLSTTELDFGEVAYNETIAKDFFIENIGKVPFEFNINFGPVSRPGILECSQMRGKVIAGEKFKVTVRFFPGIPDNIRECFLVECAHFPAERFTVKAVGIYPGCLLSFPRVDQDDFELTCRSMEDTLAANKIQYTSRFRGNDAMKQMPPIPKKPEKEMVLKDTNVMEVEAECDRQVLCGRIVTRINECLDSQQMEQPSVSAHHLDSIATATVPQAQQRSGRPGPPAPKPSSGVDATANRSSGFTDAGSTYHAAGGIKFGGYTINLDNINISSYVCDFGNVVVGSSKKKSFRLTNVGKIPVSFQFDKKMLNNAQINIEPDKAVKLMANQSIMFNVVYSTRKNNKFGRQRFPIPIQVKNGPTYTIDFIANMTIPELSIITEQPSMPADSLDFSKVCVNTRKTMKIRLQNDKEVNCEWKFLQKTLPNDVGMVGATSERKGEGDRFQVWPQSGMLVPGQRTTVDVMFTPNSEKLFQQKLAFKCAENQKLFILNTKGQGINYEVKFDQDIIQLDPVLPYDTSAIACFEMRNPMDTPIEVYSLDFDRQYTEEEQILHRMDNFHPDGANEPIFLPMRKPGGEFWTSIRQQDEKKQAIDGVRSLIKQAEEALHKLDQEEAAIADYEQKVKERDEEPPAEPSAEAPADEKEEPEPLVKPEKEQEQIDEERKEAQEARDVQVAKLQELLQDSLEVKLPPPVKDENKLNIFMIGPKECGKTTAANYMAQEHQRAIIQLDKLYDYFVKRGHPYAEEATKFLEEQQVKLAELKEEEAKTKKKPKKKGEPEKQEIRDEDFEQIPKDLLKKMLTKRLEEEDCNAGVIYDNLESRYWATEKDAIELICEVCPNQNMQMVLFNFQKERQGDEDEEALMETTSHQTGKLDDMYMEVCTNYRYARRHDLKFKKTDVDEETNAATGTREEVKDTPKVGGKKKIMPKKGSKKPDPKKDPVQEAAEKKAAEEAEEERKRKEQNAERRRKLFEARESYVPKNYTEEEKEEYGKYAEEIANFFGHIVQRQKIGAVDEAQELASGEDPKEREAIEDSQADIKKSAAEIINYGSRQVTDQFVHYDFTFLCEKVCHIVPEPMWPDPDKEPLPEPVTNSIIKKVPVRSERSQITSYSIWTPIEGDQPTEEEQKSQLQEEGVADGDEEEPKERLPEMNQKQTRWTLGAKESKKLYVKFFSKKVGDFNQVLEFEIVGSYRPFRLNLHGTCVFPMVSTNPRNVFLSQKRIRPPTAPESYLSKCYVNSEGTFDFGPLLIKKDPEKRNDEIVKKVNGTFFQITNNGRYKLEATFLLKSSLPAEERLPGDEGILPDRSPFLMEPQEMTLAVGETKNLNVFAFPQDAPTKMPEDTNNLTPIQLPFQDQIVVLIKDNPNPVIFPVQCLGAKPIVSVTTNTENNDKITFERTLLTLVNEKTIKLKNECAIPVKWRLTGVDKLPEEFEVSLTEGRLEPTKVVEVNVTFKAMSEKKFAENIVLEVEDVEDYQVKQDNKVIALEAEAFKISLNEMTQELDFEAVRVGEPKVLSIPLKNQGMYPIKFNFSMNKESTKECFTIDPQDDRLEPGQERDIKVRFLSKKEMKLRTSTGTSDILLNILEGEYNVKFNSIPICVSVNAVFSKYSISPLRNINFGPMQFGEIQQRTFEIRNEGLHFDFKYNICDIMDEEAKKSVAEQRQKELEERLGQNQEEEEKKKDAGKAKKEAAKAPAKKGAKEVVPDGTICKVAQYDISPAIGSVAPGNCAVITVKFEAQGDMLYDNTLAIDIANRDQSDMPGGIPFQLCAESSHPGINTKDVDQIFEEQTVIPSLDPSINTQTVISSSLFSIAENVFWFGTLVASKNQEGTKERFKIMNPNKIPCTIKFAVNPRSQSKSEGFAFDVEPKGLTIDPHKHKYVTVSFMPTEMKQYGGIFEAMVEHGDPESRMGKLVFEIRGEGTLPTLQTEKPTEQEADGTPALRFRKTRIGKDAILSIVLKNEGQVPATARFDAITNDAFTFEGGSLSHTITQKSYHAFDIKFRPKSAQMEKFLLTFATLNNVYEQHKVLLQGQGYEEAVTFEGLPEEAEDELLIGDCVIGKGKATTFYIVNNGDATMRFRWNAGDKEEFKFYPSEGLLRGHSSKRMKIMVKGIDKKKYDKIDLNCELNQVDHVGEFSDWDDTMKTLRMVRPSEYKKIMRDREVAASQRRDQLEADALAKAGKKAAKPPAKDKKKGDEVEEEIEIDESEDPNVELIEVIPEPDTTPVEGSEKNIVLKSSCVIDHASYECNVTKVDFKPTLMYAARSYKFTIKNTSLINLDFNFKIVNSSSGILDAGPYSIIPKKGTIAPGCDDNFIVKYSPVEVEADNSRILSANVRHLAPDAEPLIIEVNGVAERPVIHFELPPTNYRERKEKDMTPVDAKFKIIEFESLGTMIRNTKRFMAVNPTATGYEFEWEEIQEQGKVLKPMFKCTTLKGLILSGKKSEMVFEYTPDSVGEHESKWLFKIPSENIQQHFLIVGRVNEPNVLFESGKIRFGPLLLQGKNKETVRIINQEEIPFAFNFSRESIRGNPDYGDSLKVTPISGVVPAQSDLPIEVQFTPKFELTYNYNLTCNVKRKARPLVLNVKGEGYKIHHKIFAGEPRVEVPQPIAGQAGACPIDFGEFFINERKVRKVVLQNNGEFNFDFVWKRQVNKYVTIVPDTGTVQKGSEVEIELIYLPIAEHALKNYRCALNIVSGPKYDFNLTGLARKPGVKLNATVFDFGQCFVTGQPSAIKKYLEMTNLDAQALSIESDFQKTQYLDFPLTPGQVLMPDKGNNTIKVPILFTPREIRKYQETIRLDFNGLYQVDILIKAQGIPLNLDLRDPDQTITDIGIVSVGGSASKVVPIINRSQKPVKFNIFPRDPEAFARSALTISVDKDKECVLKPKENLPVTVRFNPKSRLPPFSQEIMLRVEGVEEVRPLFSVTGVAHGIELKLMENTLAFGAVVVDSQLTKPMQLSNFGDVKASFSWDTKAFGKNFTISPASGYVNPNANLDIEITFHPKVISENNKPLQIQEKVSCEVQGGEPMSLNLVGKSVAQESKEEHALNFNTVVRKATTQNVNIQNPEDKEWAINPTISSTDSRVNYFTGKQTLVVPAKGQANFEVVYTPMGMTSKQKKAESEEMEDVPHQGSLFFPLPNGSALLYTLRGVATEPDCEQTFNETLQARNTTNIVIPVKNWARETQRFSADLKVEGEEDPGLFIRGATTFDISAASSKDYKLNFMAMRAGLYKLTCTFKVEATGEYIFYKVNATVEESNQVENIELVSPIRESVTRGIVIENPTSETVVINQSQFTIGNEYVEVTPEELKIPAKDSRKFEINFRPLMISESECDFTLKNPILGDYKYKLLLKGIAPTSQRSLAFKCALGQDQMQAFKFTHYMKKQTTYAVKVERLDGPGTCDFKADVASVPAAAAESSKGVVLQVNIRYEPFTIGDSRGVLKLQSPEGMEYSCLLFGKSQAPQPQGPIKISPGAKAAGVDFKNPLNEKCEFSVSFDNNNFSLASKLPGPLDPGKSVNLQIKYDGKGDLPSTGRMIVATKGLPPWIYYLQGE